MVVIVVTSGVTVVAAAVETAEDICVTIEVPEVEAPPEETIVT